jgi:predicted dehydrogenase
MAPTDPLRIGLVGFGFGGEVFHGPFIEAARGVELAGVVSRSPKTRAGLERRFPGVPAYPSLAELAAGERAGAGLDAVTITTPPDTRRALVLEALSLGLHVVADKPFAPDAAGAEELDAAARSAGLVLSVYHNRRWDSDIVTLRALLDSGRLGAVTRFHSRMDQGDGSTMEGGPSGGLLRDLGSHVVDQALWLFGPAQRVYATLEWVDTPQGRTDSAFVLSITHRSGVTSQLSASKLNYLDGRELRVYGALGSYLARGIDVQARDAISGLRPVDDREGWGHEPESAWGTLNTAAGSVPVPAEQGDYTDYYERFAAAVREGGPAPVSAAEAVRVLEVLDAARLSAERGAASELG